MNKKTRDIALVSAYKVDTTAELLEHARNLRTFNDPDFNKTAELLEKTAIAVLTETAEALHYVAKPSKLAQIINFLKDC